jgi:hypothetical protein
MNLKNKIGLIVLAQESVWIQMISLLKFLEIKVLNFRKFRNWKGKIANADMIL